MAIAKYVKTPDERKRYTIDYDDWLDLGETVSNTAFTIETNTLVNPLVINGFLIDNAGRLISFFVSGGEDADQYKVLVETTTSGGQIKEDSILYLVMAP